MESSKIAEPIINVTNLMAVELMRQKVPVDFSRAVACTGLCCDRSTVSILIFYIIN